MNKKPKGHTRHSLIQARVSAAELQVVLEKMWVHVGKDNMGEYIRLACLNYKGPKAARPGAK